MSSFLIYSEERTAELPLASIFLTTGYKESQQLKDELDIWLSAEVAL